MGKDLFATLTLIVSLDVGNDETSILEGACRLYDQTITGCELSVRDWNGNLHKLHVHDWKSEIHSLVDDES